MWKWIIRIVVDHKWAITVIAVIHLLICLFLIIDSSPLYFVIAMAYFPTTDFLDMVLPPVGYALGALLIAIFGLFQWLLLLGIFITAKRAVFLSIMTIRNGSPHPHSQKNPHSPC